jgi:hypothetical protein
MAQLSSTRFLSSLRRAILVAATADFPFATDDNLNVAMINCVASLLPHLGQNAQRSLGQQPYLFEKQARFPRRDLRRTRYHAEHGI